jgi:hypothetical protein
MQSKFLRSDLPEQVPSSPPSPEPEQVTVTFERQLAEKVLDALQSGLARG